MKLSNIVLVLLGATVVSGCNYGGSSSSTTNTTSPNVNLQMESQIFTQNTDQPAKQTVEKLTVTLNNGIANQKYSVTFADYSDLIKCAPITMTPGQSLTTDCVTTNKIGTSVLNAMINDSTVGSMTFTTGNNLFSQPSDNNDNSCGIRQLLIAKHVLNNASGRYIDDILPVWTGANTIMKNEYGSIFDLLPDDYKNDLPSIYTYQAVEAVDGGPRNLASNVIAEGESSLGLHVVKAYINKNQLKQLFGALYDEEISKIEALGVPIEYINAPMTQNQFESGSYYMVVVNNGNHWVGTTNQITYNSEESKPIPYNSQLIEQNFSGAIFQYQLAPQQ